MEEIKNPCGQELIQCGCKRNAEGAESVKRTLSCVYS